LAFQQPEDTAQDREVKSHFGWLQWRKRLAAFLPRRTGFGVLLLGEFEEARLADLANVRLL